MHKMSHGKKLTVIFLTNVKEVELLNISVLYATTK